MIIQPFTEFKIKNKIYFSSKEINTNIDNSYIVVDIINTTDYENINALPVGQFVYNSLEEKYIIDNFFIKVGEVKDLCLI